MCEGVVETIERRAAGRPVAGVGLRVGTLHRVLPAAFEQSFEMVSAGSVADGASVDLVILPVTGRCPDCASDFESSDPIPLCPGCGSTGVQLSGGDELLVEWIQYREV